MKDPARPGSIAATNADAPWAADGVQTRSATCGWPSAWRGAAPGHRLHLVKASADPRVSQCPISSLSTVVSDDSRGDSSRGGHPRRTTLEDRYDNTRVFG